MNTSEKLKTVAANVERVYDAGIAEGERQCRQTHCCMCVKGDGSDALTVALPFEPDVLYISTNTPDIRTEKAKVAYVEIDFTALGQLAGKRGGSTSAGSGASTYINMLCAPSSAYGMYQRADDGTVTISGVTISTSNLGLCSFAAGVDYVVLASKLELPPLKTRIEQSVRRLPDTVCTAYYQSAKINEALTSDEWAALMETKPNCTFSMC